MDEEQLVTPTEPAQDWLSGGSEVGSGMESVDVGNLDDVKEERQVIPAAKGVELLIIKAEAKSNDANTYRRINLQLKLTKGIDVEGKYKNKVVFGSVCYYADPNVYVKDFFKKKQHLVQLKYLKNSVGWQYNTVDQAFLVELQGKTILGDITVKKNTTYLDDGKGGKVAETYLTNEVRNYKVQAMDSQV
jgi:hypothetical protein